MGDSTANRTMSRKKRKGKSDEVIKNILNVLKTSQRPMATQEIADRLAKPWHSIQTRCLRLQIEEKVSGFRVGNINLWQIRGDK